MRVQKRNGKLELLNVDKLTKRVKRLCNGLDDKVRHEELVDKVINGAHEDIATNKLDILAAETAATMATNHPDYSILASRFEIKMMHKTTPSKFSEAVEELYNIKDHRGNHKPMISDKLYKLVSLYKDKINSVINPENDFNFDYFGIKTLQKAYLKKIGDRLIETPQYLFMRVALGIHGFDLDGAFETYRLLSEKKIIHATPTLFNAGTTNPYLSSCFLLEMDSDSIEGIYDTLKKCAKISQASGGIGLSIHKIRANGSAIHGTGGISNGIVPMLRNFDMTARYVDQGGGKRKGSIAVYIEPWHPEIDAFLDLKKNHGKEELRARDLFYALWIPDLFMQRVKEDGDWSLFCPSRVDNLEDYWGEEFNKRYIKYEKEGLATSTIKARDLWNKILSNQIETGVPYILYKDACNEKSNQKNLGTIKSSNLCVEIIEYTSKDEVAVCNLGSISLPKCYNEEYDKFDFERLYYFVEVMTRNLNKVIDENKYPVEEAKNSNMRHRPIGIGVQGLADIFLMLKYPFGGSESRLLNKQIFETIYYSSLMTSIDLAKKDGAYSSYEGSPLSQGILQHDMWNVEPTLDLWDWDELRAKLKKYGARNSLLVAPMPTASTAQIIGNNECFEPYTSNIYVKRTLAGEFIYINRHLLKDLINLNLWNNDIRNDLMRTNGSIQGIDAIPDDVKYLYRTVWEISQKDIIDMAADRSPFICQSQSLNIHMESATTQKLTSMHFYAWEKGLKTGMYYLRTRPAVDPIKFTVPKQEESSKPKYDVCSTDGTCTSCE